MDTVERGVLASDEKSKLPATEPSPESKTGDLEKGCATVGDGGCSSGKLFPLLTQYLRLLNLTLLLETELPPLRGLSFLDRFLVIWILLAMALGIILGNTVDSVGPALQKGQLVGVSVPIGKLFTFAHYTNGPLASPLAFIHSSQFITHPSKLWILFFHFLNHPLPTILPSSTLTPKSPTPVIPVILYIP